MLAGELTRAQLVNANSILEWRLTPSRLNDELAAFLDDFYAAPRRSRGAARAHAAAIPSALGAR